MYPLAVFASQTPRCLAKWKDFSTIRTLRDAGFKRPCSDKIFAMHMSFSGSPRRLVRPSTIRRPYVVWGAACAVTPRDSAP